MKSSIIIISILFGLLSFSSKAQQSNDKIQIMLVGFGHLSQLGNGTEEANIFSKKKQAELEKLSAKIEAFQPDAVMVELTPEDQSWTDSVYTAYKNGILDLENLEYGAGETFQVAFRVAQAQKLDHVYGIDFDNSTSQTLLKDGDHYEIFQNQLSELQHTARPMAQMIQKDSLSIYDFVKKINEPEIIQLTHRLIFNLPAYVQNGEWDKDGLGYRELNEQEKQYAGAEYISEFYNRNLKIYSNILNTQLKTGSKKIYLQMGQAHIGVLEDLLEDNPNYEIIDPLTYIN